MCVFLYQLVIRWVEFRKKNSITIASNFVPIMHILNGAMYKVDDWVLVLIYNEALGWLLARPVEVECQNSAVLQTSISAPEPTKHDLGFSVFFKFCKMLLCDANPLASTHATKHRWKLSVITPILGAGPFKFIRPHTHQTTAHPKQPEELKYEYVVSDRSLLSAVSWSFKSGLLQSENVWECSRSLETIDNHSNLFLHKEIQTSAHKQWQQEQLDRKSWC